MVAATAVHLLSPVVGVGNALYLLLTAEEVDAATALRMGLVQEVVETERLMDRAESLARQIAAMNSDAISITKQISTLHRHSVSAEAVAQLAQLRAVEDPGAIVRGASAFAPGEVTSP